MRNGLVVWYGFEMGVNRDANWIVHVLRINLAGTDKTYRFGDKMAEISSTPTTTEEYQSLSETKSLAILGCLDGLPYGIAKSILEAAIYQLPAYCYVQSDANSVSIHQNA